MESQQRRVGFFLKSTESLPLVVGEFVAPHSLCTGISTMRRKNGQCHMELYLTRGEMTFVGGVPLYRDANVGFLPASVRRRIRKDRRWCDVPEQRPWSEADHQQLVNKYPI